MSFKRLPKATDITATIQWRPSEQYPHGRTTVNEIAWYDSTYITVLDEDELDWTFKRENGYLKMIRRDYERRKSNIAQTYITNMPEIEMRLKMRLWDSHAGRKWGWQDSHDVVGRQNQKKSDTDESTKGE